jgi:putative restriction endonuclease
MADIDTALEGTAGDHRAALEWFRQHTGERQTWTNIQAAGEVAARLVTQAKGIYKPKGLDYALSVRQTLDSPYADKEILRRPDGSWVYPYFQENADPAQRDRMFTNRGLVRCMEDGVPIGVLVQAKPKPGVEYDVLGLAMVRAWEAGYFILEGFSDAGQLRPPDVNDAVTARTQTSLQAFDPNDGGDTREKRLRQVAQRKGQPKFRRTLLEAYGWKCAVTDCDAEPALEAAHIAPYRGVHTNHPQNGLLLRADIHTLFDLGLLGVEPETMRVVISPELEGSTYGDLHGRRINAPADRNHQPSQDALREHLTWSGLGKVQE